MPRGGARPGAGRKPSATKVESKAKAPTVAVKKTPPRRDAPPSQATFSPGGAKSADAPVDWPFGIAPTDPPQAPHPPAPPATPVADQNLTPLDYLLSVVRDPEQDEKVRIQAAAIAAPYVHGKIAPVGKKAAKLDAAKERATGGSSRFQAAAPPKLAAANGKKV